MRLFAVPSRPVARFESDGVTVDDLPGSARQTQVDVVHVAAGGTLGRHPTHHRQLFAVIERLGAGAGRTTGPPVDVGPGTLVLWESGEAHQTWAITDVLALAVESVGVFDFAGRFPELGRRRRPAAPPPAARTGPAPPTRVSARAPAACACCRACWASPAPGRGTRPRRRRASAAARRRRRWPRASRRSAGTRGRGRTRPRRSGRTPGARPSSRGPRHERVEQRVAHATAAPGGVHGERAHLGQVGPHHVQRTAPHELPVASTATTNSWTAS